MTQTHPTPEAPETELALQAHIFHELFLILLRPDIPVHRHNPGQINLALAAQRQVCATIKALNQLKNLTKDEKSQLLDACKNFNIELMDFLPSRSPKGAKAGLS